MPLYQYTWFQEFSYDQGIRSSENPSSMEWLCSEKLTILAKVKGVEEWRANVFLSDFKVNLQELSLNGVATNLKAFICPNKKMDFLGRI